MHRGEFRIANCCLLYIARLLDTNTARARYERLYSPINCINPKKVFAAIPSHEAMSCCTSITVGPATCMIEQRG